MVCIIILFVICNSNTIHFCVYRQRTQLFISRYTTVLLSGCYIYIVSITGEMNRVFACTKSNTPIYPFNLLLIMLKST